MTKADELWEKYQKECEKYSLGHPAPFLAALAEYGASVRARDASMCGRNGSVSCENCAAAIAREPLE